MNLKTYILYPQSFALNPEPLRANGSSRRQAPTTSDEDED